MDDIKTEAHNQRLVSQLDQPQELLVPEEIGCSVQMDSTSCTNAAPATPLRTGRAKRLAGTFICMAAVCLFASESAILISSVWTWMMIILAAMQHENFPGRTAQAVQCLWSVGYLAVWKDIVDMGVLVALFRSVPTQFALALSHANYIAVVHVMLNDRLSRKSRLLWFALLLPACFTFLPSILSLAYLLCYCGRFARRIRVALVSAVALVCAATFCLSEWTVPSFVNAPFGPPLGWLLLASAVALVLYGFVAGLKAAWQEAYGVPPFW